MERQAVKWIIDITMGIFFLVSFITGLLKFTLFMRELGLTSVVLPLAFISDIHDRSGIALGFFVALHLFLNRAWIMMMTKKMVS